MRRGRWLMLVSLSLFIVGLSGAAAADGLKNLQILPKTLTKDDIKPIMRAQAKALGVECDFCHDVPDMASDKLENKKAARQMMKMMAEVNDKWLKGMKDADKNKITCGTCHQGHEQPPPFVTSSK